MKKIQKLQDRAARIILYAGNEDDIDELFQALSGRKLSHQRLIATSVMMLSTLYGLIPEYLQSPFIFRNDITSHRLTMLIINYWLFHTNYLKKTFSCRGAMFSNSLSHELRATVPLCEFKIKVRHYSFE